MNVQNRKRVGKIAAAHPKVEGACRHIVDLDYRTHRER